MKTVRDFAILIVLGLVVIYLLSRLGCMPGKKNILVITQPVKQPDTLYWKNKEGDAVISLKGTEEAFSQLRKHVADSVAAVYKTRLKDMQEYVIAWTQSQSDIPADTGSRETDYRPARESDCPPEVVNMRQRFNSPYDSIEVQIGNTSYLHKRSYDTITHVWKTVKEGSIFNRKKYLQFDISFADTSRKVTGIDIFRKALPKPKRFGLGLQAGVTYMDGSWRPYVGAGASWNIIRF